MKNILSIIAIIIFFSCNKAQITEHKNTIVKNDTIAQKTGDMKTQYVIYEFIKDLSPAEVVKKHPPISEETFILGHEGGFITEFRIELLNIFTEEEIKKGKIRLKEVTWETNDKQNITIWYKEQDKTWMPVDHFVWNKGSEF